jgi:hypoxanthine phosphoribosyltransferase
MQKVKIDWLATGQAIDYLLKCVKTSKVKFDGVYGVPRGGLPLAIAMSHHLKIPLLVYPTENCLVCDDISDTGKTLQNMKHKKIACLYTSLWTKTKPDYAWGVKTIKRSWLIFPWEDQDNE